MNPEISPSSEKNLIVPGVAPETSQAPFGQPEQPVLGAVQETNLNAAIAAAVSNTPIIDTSPISNAPAQAFPGVLPPTIDPKALRRLTIHFFKAVENIAKQYSADPFTQSQMISEQRSKFLEEVFHRGVKIS